MKGAYFKQVRTKKTKYAKKHNVRGRAYGKIILILHRVRKTGRPRDIETTRTRREGRATEREGGTKKQKHEGTNENINNP